MGKNQAYKAMQRARLGSSSGGPDDVDDGMVDGSFHTPEWHAARLASLKTSHTVTWEEFKKKQKEEEMRKGELEADKDKMMREYRAQLDAERASKLSQGRNHSSSKHSRKKDKKEKDKDTKKHRSKKRKVRDRIDALRNFIWQGNKDKQAMHLVEWKSLITSKSKGGLGIRDLNASLLMKWLWRYNVEENSLRRRLIQDKYGQVGMRCIDIVTSPYGVGVWRSIRSHWDTLLKNSKIQVGNGRKTLFRADNWLGHGSLKDLFPDLLSISTSPNDYLSTAKGLQGWNITFRRDLNDWEIERVWSFLRPWKSSRGYQKQRISCSGIQAKMGPSQSNLPT
ncbi:uncharacterized protein LOC132044787 isoform X1 [Lycium ferocissimum]|uniref:uncharacterized protein LOC132044787 isoform X1 n=2 Tax=Lycium ferocissimum TaxID=112874 RepID=UPI0028165654|nr:uncharacterized protein LOC132044787 isoform X1 [Lycium ferocissimum]